MEKEKKRMYSYRVPESLYDEIDRMVKMRINEYDRQLLVVGNVVKVDGKEAVIVSQIGTPQQFNAGDWEQFKKANWWESESVDVEKVLWERFQILQGNQKKSNPADSLVSRLVPIQDKINVLLSKGHNISLEKIEPQVVDNKIKYEILESFPFGIEKIEDYGKNKSLYFCEPDYFTRVVNEKAKHISYESAVNYLKSK